MLSEYLRNLSPKFKNVLEVGCGFGRITKLVISNHPDIQKYTAIDLSPDQINNAEQYVRSGIGNRRIKDIELTFVVSDIMSLDLDGKFDLVLAAEVLLHIIPSQIKEAMTKLVDLSNRDIINVDYYQEKITRLAPHNFLHQYEKIYHEIPTIREVRRIPIKKAGLFGVDTKQSLFHAVRDEIPN
jgi:SAM-dependent methyltransferase